MSIGTILLIVLVIALLGGSGAVASMAAVHMSVAASASYSLSF